MKLNDGYNFNSTIKKLVKFKDKELDENAKKQWRHKPYTCDFGGKEDERYGTPPSSLLL